MFLGLALSRPQVLTQLPSDNLSLHLGRPQRELLPRLPAAAQPRRRGRGSGQGSAGMGVKGVYDPLGGLARHVARPPWGITIQHFLRESLCI
jgi:hypothetical protein